MRYIYLDEAGTSAPEQISIVAGVILNPDGEWRAVEQEIERLRAEYAGVLGPRDALHATDIFSGKKSWKAVDPGVRSDLMHQLVSIPHRFSLRVVFGYTKRGILPESIYSDVQERRGVKPFEMDHIWAFSQALGGVSRSLERDTDRSEVATLIVENVETMRSHLRRVVGMAAITLPPEWVKNPPTEEVKGVHVPALTDWLVDGVHFCEKSDSKMLQLADACAFSMQRWINRRSFGESLVSKMLGTLPNVEDFDSPWGLGSYYPE